MYLIVDLVLTAIVVLSIIIGRAKGFADQALRLVSGVVSFVIAAVFTPYLANILYEKLLHSKLAEFISQKLEALASGTDIRKLLEEGFSNTKFRDLIRGLGADYNGISRQLAESDGSSESIASAIASPASNAASYALAFFILFVGTLLVFLILRLIVKGLVQLPVLKTADKFLGFLLGAIIGLGVVWILAIIIKLGLPYLSSLVPEVFPADLFERSIVLKFLYELNPFRAMFDLSDLTGKVQLAAVYYK